MADTDTQGTSAAYESTAPPLLTFLIADVRGYTRFTNEQGDEAAARLADRFAEFCEEILGAHEGRVIELRGDEALAVFPSARNALRGAVALQSAFRRAMTDDSSLPLAVGMGLDAGEAIPVRGGYRGGALNLAARLCSIAGAGEILASETVIGLARKTEGLVFVDRGQVTLKGLAAPVRVLQIAPEGEIAPDLPPLQPILATHPTNLPDEPTPFIGRETEIASIVELLRDPSIRMVTLTGPGGTGKTRLALQVGSQLLYDFADGVFFCDLAPLADPSLVPSTIAGVLGVKAEPGQDLLETLAGHLRDKHLLLVLDNFEHLLDASSIVASLLDACRDLHVLVTSRVPLHVSREQEHAVPPLAVPDPATRHDAVSLSQYESVALFIQRAKAARRSFVVTDENAPAVAEICVRLDGLPLALELAAARIKLFPPQALLQRLDSRLRLLTGGAKDKPTRQQTLRGAIAWSYGLLTEEEKTLFARLSVFAGGWSFEAAEAVCNEDESIDILEGLTSLVDKSLIRQDGEEEPRFAMLETIREYAAEKLAEQGEADALSHRHAKYLASLVEEAAPGLWRAESAGWFARLEAERDNCRVAMDWAGDHGQIDLALHMAGRLLYFWHQRGYNAEGYSRLEALLAGGSNASLQARSRALDAFGFLQQQMGAFDAASASLEESARYCEEIGDRRLWCRVILHLGQVAFAAGDIDRGVALTEQSLEAGRKMNDTSHIGRCLNNLGWTLANHGQPERGVPYLEEGLEIARASGSPIDVSSGLDSLGRARLEMGDIEGAETDWREGLAIARDGDFKYPLPYHLDGLAGVAAHRGEAARAARIFAAATRLREETGALLPPGESEPHDRDLERARSLLDEDTWDSAWVEGIAMSLEEAIAYALDEGE